VSATHPFNTLLPDTFSAYRLQNRGFTEKRGLAQLPVLLNLYTQFTCLRKKIREFLSTRSSPPATWLADRFYLQAIKGFWDTDFTDFWQFFLT